MTSLDSDTSSGDCFVGIPSSENFFIEFSFLIDRFNVYRMRTRRKKSMNSVTHIMNSVCKDRQELTYHEQSLCIQP